MAGTTNIGGEPHLTSSISAGLRLLPAADARVRENSQEAAQGPFWAVGGFMATHVAH